MTAAPGEYEITGDSIVSACCFDPTANWTTGDLNRQSFMKAWHCGAFVRLREAHLRKDVRGTYRYGHDLTRQLALPFQGVGNLGERIEVRAELTDDQGAILRPACPATPYTMRSSGNWKSLMRSEGRLIPAFSAMIFWISVSSGVSSRNAIIMTELVLA